MAILAADNSNDPVTLHRVMQSMIGEGLRSHYQAPQKLSHELFVLLLQLKEQERKKRSSPGAAKPVTRRSPSATKRGERRAAASAALLRPNAR
ncbi:MAG: hypothetical protein ABSE22_18595 [Xanthobacteraceae bacterium]